MSWYLPVVRVARATYYLIVFAVLTLVIVFTLLWVLVLRIFRIGPTMGNVPGRSDPPAE